MPTAAEAVIERQIRLVQTAIKKPFDPNPVLNDEIVSHIATFLTTQGTNDVRNLRHVADSAANVSFFFDVTTGHVYDNPISLDVIDHSQEQNGLPVDTRLINLLFAYQDAREDDYRVYCVFSSDGFPIFWATKRDHVSGWAQSFKICLGLAAVAVSFAFPALGVTIGNAILGPTVAAAYPGLAATVGNICVATAFNGGDVKAAVISTLTADIGQGVGSFAKVATDSAIIGSVASSVTIAALRGGDMQTAALQSLVVSGVKSAGDLSIFGGSDVKLGDGEDYSNEGRGSVYTPAPDPADYSNEGANYLDTSGGAAYVDPYANMPAGYLDPYADMPAGYLDPYANMPALGSPEATYGTPIASPGATTPVASPSGVVTTVNGSSLTNLALAALKGLTIWQQMGSQNIRAGNTAVAVQSNGTLRNASGTVTKPPVGVPYLTQDNSLITNNGDGTYTKVSATGGVQTLAYAATGVSGLTGMLAGIPPVYLLGGGALILILLLRK